MLEMFGRPELMTALLAGLQDGVVILDRNSVHVFVNDAFCRMTGFGRDELIGSGPPFAYWPPEELAKIAAAFQRTLANDSATFELVFAGKDGRRIPVLVSPSSVLGAHGAVVGHVATVKDITERKRLERAMVESEQRWRSIAENPFDTILIIDRAHRIVFINNVAPGFSRESMVGKATPFDFATPEHHDAMRAAFEATFATGRATSYDTYVPRVDAWYHSIVGPIREGSEVTSLSILTRDISQQKRAEEQLRESHKIETIGTLAGGIAHDLNNILTPILAFSEVAQLSVGQEHEVQPELRSIHEAALRARDLVRRILLFSRRHEPHKEVLDLSARVRETAKMLHGTVPTSIDLVLDLPDEPIWVLADRSRLDQVVVNLAANALQAMHDGGGKLVIAVRPGLGGAGATLTVADSGRGMDAETQRRAFDPFFTTRPGLGSGLGLAIVQRIVRDFGGRVSVTSAPGRGATFEVQLPVVAAPAALSRAPVDPPQVAAPARLRVWCVDDEPAVLEVAHSALETSGHLVLSFSSPLQALEALKADPQALDVLVTDQTMPQVSGTSLIRAARVLRPDLRCLVMTGFADDAMAAQVRALGAVEILPKPFSATSLVAAVERVAAARH